VFEYLFHLFFYYSIVMEDHFKIEFSPEEASARIIMHEGNMQLVSQDQATANEGKYPYFTLLLSKFRAAVKVPTRCSIGRSIQGFGALMRLYIRCGHGKGNPVVFDPALLAEGQPIVFDTTINCLRCLGVETVVATAAQSTNHQPESSSSSVDASRAPMQAPMPAPMPALMPASASAAPSFAPVQCGRFHEVDEYIDLLSLELTKLVSITRDRAISSPNPMRFLGRKMQIATAARDAIMKALENVRDVEDDAEEELDDPEEEQDEPVVNPPQTTRPRRARGRRGMFNAISDRAAENLQNAMTARTNRARGMRGVQGNEGSRGGRTASAPKRRRR
jgi:hypothetical protein